LVVGGVLRAWDRASLDQLEKQLREAGGAALDATATDLFRLSPMIALLDAVPPCDLELDVLPAVRAVAAGSKPSAIRRWTYFRPAIIKARDERLTPTPAVVVDFQTGKARPGADDRDPAVRAAVRAQLIESYAKP
jgi:hypothetical protein